MEPLKRPALGIMFLAAVLLPLRSSASQQAEARKPSNTWQMRCVLKVSADAQVVPLSFDLVEMLLRSDAIAGKTAAACPKGHGVFDKYFDIVPLEESASRLPREDDVATSEAGDPRPDGTRTVLLAIQSAARDLYAATAELKGIQEELTTTRRDDPQAARLRQVIQTIEQCGRSYVQSASGGGYDLVPIPLPPAGEDKTVAQRIAAKQSDLREVSRRIAEMQRIMNGEKRFDPELSRVEQTARRCEQIDARICDLKTRIENLQPCTVAVLGGTE